MSTALTLLHHQHHGQGRGGSRKETFFLRVSPALHPPERPSPRRADMAGHGLGRETRERRYHTQAIMALFYSVERTVATERATKGQKN